MCLRGGRVADTHFTDWSQRGGTWATNPDDTPRAPSSTECARRRLIRCVRMRSIFTQDRDVVDTENRVFQAYDTMGDCARSPDGG